MNPSKYLNEDICWKFFLSFIFGEDLIILALTRLKNFERKAWQLRKFGTESTNDIGCSTSFEG